MGHFRLMDLVDNMPTNFQLAEWLTDSDVIDSRISNRYILDYGTIQSISSDGTRAVIQHQVQVNLSGTLTTLITKNVEVLYSQTSNLLFDSTPKAGDWVLLFGLRRYIESTLTPAPSPSSPSSNISYDRSCLKCLPLSTIGSQSSLIFKAIGGKLRLRNSAVSLFKILNDFMSALNTFGNTSSSATTVPQIAAAAGIMVTSMTTVIQELAQLLVD